MIRQNSENAYNVTNLLIVLETLAKLSISTPLAYNLISCCKNPEFRRTYSKF